MAASGGASAPGPAAGVVAITLPEDRQWRGSQEELRVRAAAIFNGHDPIEVEMYPPIQAVIVKELNPEEVALLTAAGYEWGEATRPSVLPDRFVRGDKFLVPPGSGQKISLYQEAQRLGPEAVARFWGTQQTVPTESPTYVPDPAQFERMATTIWERIPVKPGQSFMLLPYKFVYDTALTDGQRFVLESAGYIKRPVGRLIPSVPAGVNPNAEVWVQPVHQGMLGIQRQP